MTDFSMKSKRLELACSEFNRVSKTKIPNAEAFQRMLSISPKLRKWYEDWSFQFSAFSEMPKSFAKAGVSPEKWREIQSKLPKINSIRKSASDDIAVKAEEFSKYVKMKEDEVNSKVAELEDEYVKILKVNVLCLDIDTQLEILSKPEVERDSYQSIKIEELREKLLRDLEKGEFKDPFVFGDFKELLL